MENVEVELTRNFWLISQSLQQNHFNRYLSTASTNCQLSCEWLFININQIYSSVDAKMVWVNGLIPCNDHVTFWYWFDPLVRYLYSIKTWHGIEPLHVCAIIFTYKWKWLRKLQLIGKLVAAWEIVITS